MKNAFKSFTKRMLFDYPLTRFEVIGMLAGMMLVSITGSWILTVVVSVWILTSETTTDKLQKLWKDKFGEK